MVAETLRFDNSLFLTFFLSFLCYFLFLSFLLSFLFFLSFFLSLLFTPLSQYSALFSLCLCVCVCVWVSLSLSLHLSLSLSLSLSDIIAGGSLYWRYLITSVMNSWQIYIYLQCSYKIKLQNNLWLLFVTTNDNNVDLIAFYIVRKQDICSGEIDA